MPWLMTWRGMANGMARQGDGMTRYGEAWQFFVLFFGRMTQHDDFSIVLSNGVVWLGMPIFFAWYDMTWQILSPGRHGTTWRGIATHGMAWQILHMAWHGKMAWRWMGGLPCLTWCVPGIDHCEVLASLLLKNSTPFDYNVHLRPPPALRVRALRWCQAHFGSLPNEVASLTGVVFQWP